MIAVIFEVWPAEGAGEHYLDIAAALRDDLARIAGFVSVERFESLTIPCKVLSLSVWRDEEAVRAWRGPPTPPRGAGGGARRVFRVSTGVASVVRDYGMTERDEAPTDSRAAHQA